MRRFKLLSFFALPVIATSALLTCCSPPPPPPTPAPPPPPVAQAPQPAPAVSWRDAPLTPGNWIYKDGIATFDGVRLSGSPPFELRCDRARRTVSIFTLGFVAGSAPQQLKITTTFASKAFAISNAYRHGEFTVELPAGDPFLDSLAYTLGRFLVERPNGDRLVLRAAPEVARVIEDCRG